MLLGSTGTWPTCENRIPLIRGEEARVSCSHRGTRQSPEGRRPLGSVCQCRGRAGGTFSQTASPPTPPHTHTARQNPRRNVLASCDSCGLCLVLKCWNEEGCVQTRDRWNICSSPSRNLSALLLKARRVRGRPPLPPSTLEAVVFQALQHDGPSRRTTVSCGFRMMMISMNVSW